MAWASARIDLVDLRADPEVRLSDIACRKATCLNRFRELSAEAGRCTSSAELPLRRPLEQTGDREHCETRFSGVAMNSVRTRLHIAEDGTITGQAPGGALPPGDHDAEIVLHPRQAASLPSQAAARAAIRALQDELARLPVLDPRTPDEILGYNEIGLFD